MNFLFEMVFEQFEMLSSLAKYSHLMYAVFSMLFSQLFLLRDVGLQCASVLSFTGFEVSMGECALW